MLGLNGGLIGKDRSTAAAASVPGVWTLGEQLKAKRLFLWTLNAGEDFYFGNVSLLLRGDGANGSTTFTDASANNFTITPVGNAQISTAQSKFGGASMYFDGSGDYLTCTPGSIGSGDFTMEAWVYYTNFANYRMIYDSRTSDGDAQGFVWGANSSGQIFVYHSNQFRLAVGPISLSTWTHLSLVRSSGVWRIAINGVFVGSTYTSTADLTRTATRIGMDWATLYGMHGYIDDLRITKGVARYTANFTPPEAL